jgi:hypothetical protein
MGPARGWRETRADRWLDRPTLAIAENLSASYPAILTVGCQGGVKLKSLLFTAFDCGLLA